MGAFDYVNSINETKENLIRGSHSPEASEKMYDPFVASRSLSYHQDCILLVNELNSRGLNTHGVTKKQHYEFLLNVLNKKKRYAKWGKIDKIHEDIKFIMSTFDYSEQKAREVYPLFSESQLEDIRELFVEGG